MRRAAQVLIAFFFGLTLTCAAAERRAQEPDRNQSPRKTYLLRDSRPSESATVEHRILIARYDQPKRFHAVYTYSRYADAYFSPDEKHLVVTDRSGSGWAECALLRRVDRAPFFVPEAPTKVDEACWALFWREHGEPKSPVRYDHRSTYLCEWLDGTRFVVGLMGNNQLEGRRWSLEGGWHCIYDVRAGRVYSDKLTAELNEGCELLLH